MTAASQNTGIFCSGNLDEYRLQELVAKRRANQRLRHRNKAGHFGRCAQS